MTHHLTQVAHIELPVTDFAGIEVVRFKCRIATMPMPMPMAGPGGVGPVFGQVGFSNKFAGKFKRRSNWVRQKKRPLLGPPH